MVSSDGPGEYDVAFEALAGTAAGDLKAGTVAYITTGADKHAHPALHFHAACKTGTELKAALTEASKSRLDARQKCASCNIFHQIPSAALCINAGASLPHGADAVVQIENTKKLAPGPDGQQRVRIVKVHHLQLSFCSARATTTIACSKVHDMSFRATSRPRALHAAVLLSIPEGMDLASALLCVDAACQGAWGRRASGGLRHCCRGRGASQGQPRWRC